MPFFVVDIFPVVGPKYIKFINLEYFVSGKRPCRSPALSERPRLILTARVYLPVGGCFFAFGGVASHFAVSRKWMSLHRTVHRAQLHFYSHTRDISDMPCEHGVPGKCSNCVLVFVYVRGNPTSFPPPPPVCHISLTRHRKFRGY